MKVALIGSVSSSWHCLKALIDAQVEVVGVCGLHARHAQAVSDYRDLGELAGQSALDYLAFDKVTESAVGSFLVERSPDLLFVIGLSQMVPRDMWSGPPAGSIGFHPTMLPRMRGRAPVAWTILLNEQPAVSLFFLTDAADAGDIVIQRPVPLLPDDYAADLIARTNDGLEACLHELAPAIRAGDLPRTPQEHAQATWLGKRTREDGRIDWTWPVERIYRLIRAASRPYPGAYTDLKGRELIVWRARPHDREDHTGTIGQIMGVAPGPDVLVQTGGGLLWLTDLAYADGSRPNEEESRIGQRLGTSAAR